ncbi:MAG TPA: hypothetical protein VNV62_04410 [Trebonia sp.]|nr:hypothetical protein [Trebonia sp.]
MLEVGLGELDRLAGGAVHQRAGLDAARTTDVGDMTITDGQWCSSISLYQIARARSRNP